MISPTESFLTYQAMGGINGNICRFIVRSALTVAAVAALVYLSADSPDLDLTISAKDIECPIHHVELVVARPPISYDELDKRDQRYFSASKVSFPHAGKIVFASHYDYAEWPISYRFARVRQCPGCASAG